MSAPTFIDLFCGCGGFTLGMLRAGFECKADVDFNPRAIAVLRGNLQARSPSAQPSTLHFFTVRSGFSPVAQAHRRFLLRRVSPSP